MSNNLAAFNAQVWSKRIVQKLDQVNVMLRLINKDYEGELQNVGDTVKVRTPGSITMSSYTKGGTISYQDLAPSLESMTIADASYLAFECDDIDRAQNDLNAMDVYMKRALVAISNAVEAKPLTVGDAAIPGAAIISGAAAGTGAAPGTVTITNGAVTAIALGTAGSGYGTTPPIVTIAGGGGAGAVAHAVLTAGAVSSYVVDSGGAGYTSAPTATASGGVPIALDSSTSTTVGIYQQFVKARSILSKNNVPFDGRWAVIDPDSTGLLLEDTAHFVRATSLGDGVVTSGKLGEGDKGPGYVGRCAGFDVYETPHVPTSTVGGVAAKSLLFGDDQLISYAAQIVKLEALRLQTTFADAIRGLLLHDAKVFAECSKRGAKILAAA